MKNVLRKIALMREHNVELATISELTNISKEASKSITDFADEFAKLEMLARELIKKGNDTMALSEKVISLGKDVEKSVIELGFNPKNMDELKEYRSTLEQIDMNKDDLDNVLQILNDIANI